MFKKLTSVERKKLFSTLKPSSRVWFLKARGESIYQAHLKSIMSGKVILLDHAGSAVAKKTGSFVTNFSHRSEKYFFLARASFTKDGICIEMPDDVFVLQRRKSERIPVVHGSGLKCIVKTHRFGIIGLPSQVEDFGPTGCRLHFHFNTPIMKVDSAVRLEFKLGTKLIFEVDGSVRHTKLALEKKKPVQILGIEFKNVGAALQTRLLVMFMDLQKKALEHLENSMESRNV